MPYPSGEFIYFVYGLAFILMGAAIAVQPRGGSEFAIARILPWLAAFGLIHGSHEWLELWGGVRRIEHLESYNAVLLTVSFLCLHEFGRRLCRLGAPAAGRWRPWLEWLTSPLWYLPVALVLTTAAVQLGLHGFHSAVRYLLGLPAGLATAAGFCFYYRSEAARLHRFTTHGWFLGACAAFGGYALAGGLVAPAADFFPANRFNSELFLRTTQMPIELIRAALAVAAAVSIVALQRVFHREVRERMRDALAEAGDTLRRLSQVTVRHEQILRIAGSGLVGIDRNGRCLFANPRALNLLGYERAELVGQSFFERVRCSCDDGSYPTCPLKLSARSGRRLHRDTDYFRRKDGSRMPVEYVCDPVQEGGDLKGGVVLSFNDITHRRETEQRLREASESLAEQARALERANIELEQYAYVAAHDLKAPVRAVSMLASVVEDDVRRGDTQQAADHMALLRDRAQRMNRFIDDLLAYARAGRGGADPEPVDLNALLTEVSNSLAPPPGFEISHDHDLPTLVTRRLPLQQVLANLLGNAIQHHHRSEGHVHIAVRAYEGGYEFAVSDDGPGIPAEYHATVFQVFQVLATKNRTEHSGLGLALVKKLVEAQDGRLWIESAPGRGTTLRFTWPAIASAAEPALGISA